jgi:phosphatidate cytidylyltransferase
VVTALLLAVLVIVVLFWFPPAAVVAAVVAVMLAGAWEWAGFAGLKSPWSRLGYVAAVALVVALAWRYTADPQGLGLFLRAAVAWWLFAFLWVAVAAGRGGVGAAAAGGILALVPAAVGIGRLALVEPHGRVLVLFLLVLIAAADVGAYFGGRTLGRHKLAPRVSPGKTWEGFGTGMAAAAVAAALGAALFDLRLVPWIAMCVVVACLSVVGDLVESMFKRHAGLKDSGTLLPGHGGVLDRIDSALAAGPAFLLGLELLGAVP